MKISNRLCLSLIITFFTLLGKSQNKVLPEKVDTAGYYKIELKDGSTFVGKIIFTDDEKLLLNTELLSNVEIKLSAIKKLNAIKITVSDTGQYWFSSPNSSRYLMGNSAFTLKKGEIDYQNIYLSVNSFNYGVSDNFTVGGGFELISTFSSLSDGDFKPIFFINSKLGFKSNESLRFSASALYVRVPSNDGASGYFIPNGTLTVGNENSNVSGTLGAIFDGNSSGPKGLFSFSAIRRVSKRVAFISENWALFGENSYIFVSYGLRFLGEKVSVDLAFFNSKDIVQELPIGIPYLDFVVKF